MKIISLCLAVMLAPVAFAQTRGPVVVELFTSEGCSSCPPADVLLTRLDSGVSLSGSRNAKGTRGGTVEVIALGEHVDYWDGPGWKDRFSSPLFSARQQDYGRAFGAASVYTPQAVVNGGKEVLGSDLQALSRAIGEAANAPRATVELQFGAATQIPYSSFSSKPAPMPNATAKGPDALRSLFVKIGKLPVGSHNSEVFLAIAEDNIDTDVAGGENGGHRLHHTAVVRSMSRLAELDPTKPGEYAAEAKVNLRDEWKRPNLKVVVFVQDRQTRKILGAASLRY